MTNPSAGPTPASPLTATEDRKWASFAHFGGVLFFIPALIIFIVFRDRGALTRQESKEALNWQITYSIAAIALSIVLSIITGILLLAGAWPIAQLLGNLPFLLYLVNVVFSILGGVKVNGGGSYRYPFALRLIK